MLWFLAVMALLLAIALPRFRSIGLVLAAVLVVVVLTIVIVNNAPHAKKAIAVDDNAANSAPLTPRKFDFNKYLQEKKDAEDPEAKTRIPLTEARFEGISVTAGIESGTIQAIRARLYNDSRQFTLTDYAYYLTVKDCAPTERREAAAERCTTVYDQRDQVSTIIPPRQARDVVISIRNNPSNSALPFKILGNAQVDLVVTQTGADPTSDKVP